MAWAKRVVAEGATTEDRHRDHVRVSKAAKTHAEKHVHIDTPADVDDMWVHYWCPQPAGIDLAKANCPAGTHPLWSNGQATVFTRLTQDKHGNDVFDFAVC